MRGRDGGGKAGEECSMSCCIRMTGGGVQRQGVRGISWWLCIGGWLVGGYRRGFRPPATGAPLY